MTPQIITTSEIRKAYFLNKYVIITPSRLGRPRDVEEHTIPQRKGVCVLCPEKIEKDLIIEQFGSGKKWSVVSLKNKYPAVTPNNTKAYGFQEVIVETPNHAVELADLSTEHIEKIFKMYSERTKSLGQTKNIDYVLVFKNQGSKAGASLLHAHSQIFATKILPPDVREELVEAQKYKTEHGRCPYCDIIKKEGKSSRKIYQDRNILAFAPYASEFHYEAWLFTKRHLDNVSKMTPEETKSMARALKKILVKLRGLSLSYNYFMHQIVSHKDQHFYLKIQPRDSVWAGVELGSGLVINSISPEVAAKFYREE